MNNRRKLIVAIGVGAPAAPFACFAQQQGKIWRIGWLKIRGPQHTPDQLQAFREGMRALVLSEGRNYVLEERYANGDTPRS